MELGKQNKSKATINRKISALRTYFDYMIEINRLFNNPFENVRAGKADSRVIDYLTIEETEQLLALPDDSPKGIRDKALLEFLYGTGARVTELARLKYEDINFRMGFVTLKDANDESRIVPLGRYAKAALEEYILDKDDTAEGRSAYKFMHGGPIQEHDSVFINMKGEELTRQGIWKILKQYGAELGIEERMTPQILRDSFAVHILMNGGDLKTLQELMGFEDMAVGIAYLSVTEIHVRDVFQKCHPRA